MLVGKLVVDFLQVIIAYLSLALTAEALIGPTSKSAFVDGEGHFGCKY